MESLWVTQEDYQFKTKQEKLERVLQSIEDDYRDKILKSNGASGLVLVHPTEETQSLNNLAEQCPNFRQLCTAISNGIDIADMYSNGLSKKMGIHHDDRIKHNILHGMVDKIGRVGLLSKLRLLINSVIEIGETFSWIPVLEHESDIPTIPKDYVIVFFPGQNEWIVRDLENNILKIFFINEVDSQLKPKSTVSYMMRHTYEIEVMRGQFLKSVAFVSKPCYIASFHRHSDTSKKNGDSKLLDETLVNQAKMNEQLESMVMDKVRQSSKFADSAQKKTSLSGHLNNFVSDLGSTYVKEMKEKRLLEVNIHDLKERLEQSEVDMSGGHPQRWVVPEDYDLGAVKLNVQPIDILSFEKRYDKDWLTTCIGYCGKSAHIKGDREKLTESSHLEMIHMSRKQKMYANILIYDILQDWSEKSGISLCLSDEPYAHIQEKVAS